METKMFQTKDKNFKKHTATQQTEQQQNWIMSDSN